MNEDIDNLERELMSLRPVQPGEVLRQRVGAVIDAHGAEGGEMQRGDEWMNDDLRVKNGAQMRAGGSAPSPRSGGEGWGEGAANPASTNATTNRTAIRPTIFTPARRRLIYCALIAHAAVIVVSFILQSASQPTPSLPPTPRDITAMTKALASRLPQAESSPFTWLACHRAAAVSEDALAALLDEQARQMPAMAGGTIGLRTELSRLR